MVRVSHISQKTALVLIVNNILSKLNQQERGEVTAKLCQDKVVQSITIPCIIGKSITYARLVGPNWMPGVTEKPWVTFQAVKCLLRT